MSVSWLGSRFEVVLGNPGHGGFCVARHEGRVILVRHGLPGETVVVLVTEDKRGAFCRGDVVEVIEASPDRVAPRCPISGHGGSGCCDLSHAALPAQQVFKAAVVSEQLRRIANIGWDGVVEALPRTGDGTGWRTRVRLAVDGTGAAGFHRYRSGQITDSLACPQPVAGALDGVDTRRWGADAEIQVAVDSAGDRHIVELRVGQPSQYRPPQGRPGGKRGKVAARGAVTSRRAASAGPRSEHVVEGSGRPVERVGDRVWELSATGFWQAHRDAAQVYSDLVAQWAQLSPGEVAWDLYGGVGVFAAVLAQQVGEGGSVESVELSPHAVRDGRAALADLAQVGFHSGGVERVLPTLTAAPRVVVLDPPRSGAGKEVVANVAAAGPARIIHVGCDPASFARDVSLYVGHGYQVEQVRAFDAFPMTHHVECVALLTR